MILDQQRSTKVSRRPSKTPSDTHRNKNKIPMTEKMQVAATLSATQTTDSYSIDGDHDSNNYTDHCQGEAGVKARDKGRGKGRGSKRSNWTVKEGKEKDCGGQSSDNYTSELVDALNTQKSTDDGPLLPAIQAVNDRMSNLKMRD